MDRAITIVEKALEIYGAPIYVQHEIVHNKHVVQRLRDDGAVFVENVDEIPEGSHVIYSAHGVAPEVRQRADKRNLKVIDATCPLVTKVHGEAKRYAEKKHTIILIGHQDHGVTVNAVAPGFIDTAMTQALNESQQEVILQQIPLGRMGDATDIANAVAFLASEEASYITGTILHVNGGMY